MSFSAYLLALGMAANQTAAPGQLPIVSDQPAVQIVQPTPTYSYIQPVYSEHLPPLFPRLHAWIHGESYVRPGSSCGNTVMPTRVVETMAPPINKPTEEVKTVSHTEMVIKKENLPHIGAAPDFSWVTGELFKIHAGGDTFWVLRYASPEMEDKYGGSVVLGEAVDMRNFREGDLVCAHGEILNEGRANKYVGGALYRAASLDMVERNDPFAGRKDR
jgi:hypothetical protein